MAVKPLKDPRYKPMRTAPGTGRRYLDTHTGQVLTRSEFERVTTTQNGPTGSPERAAQSPGSLGKPGQPDPVLAAGDQPINVVEAPAPPPLLATAQKFADQAEALAHAATKSSDTLANKVADGLALCSAFVADALLPPRVHYLAIEADALGKVYRPAGRIVARHLPVQMGALSPDGEDLVELFNGMLFCVTAIAANKMLYDKQQERMRQEYERIYDQQHGSGSFAAALAAGAFQSGGAAARPDPRVGPAPAGQNGGDPLSAGGYSQSAQPPGGDPSRDAALLAQLYSADAQRRRERRRI